MTKKIASSTVGKTGAEGAKLGRNPFAEKPKPRSTTHLLEMLDELSPDAKTEKPALPAWFERWATLPVKGLVLGLKSWLVVRYLAAHPEEIRL